MYQKSFSYLSESGKIPVHLLYPLPNAETLQNNIPHFCGNFNVIIIFLSAKKRLALHVFMALIWTLKKWPYFSFLFKKDLFIHFERVGESVYMIEGRDRGSWGWEVDSALCGEPDVGLNPKILRSWPELKVRVRRFISWATQLPPNGLIFKARLNPSLLTLQSHSLSQYL